jgi:mannitol PTS system EIIA component
MAEARRELLDLRSIRLEMFAADKTEAIRRCGQALVDVGAVEPAYIESMLEREESVSTYMGEGVAIPHGTLSGKDAVHRDALSFLRFPDEVDWDGFPVTICIGIAATGDRHLDILAELAEILMEPEQASRLRSATEPATVLALLRPSKEDAPA